MRGLVRFGVSEDIVLEGLSDALKRFTTNHPGVELELTVGLSEVLLERLETGGLDLVVSKRRSGEQHGELVRRDPLIWVAAPDFRLDPERPLPLILLAPPSLTRSAALEALERQGRTWRIVCSSGSQSGVHAAARAGLGIAPHARSLVPPGLTEAPNAMGLPALGETEFVVLTRRGVPGRPVKALAEMMLKGSWLLGSAWGLGQG
jgi:DNA-binding transcriptional LysR family regulator